MTPIEITTLVFGILGKLASLAAKLIATGSGKTPEEVRQEIKDGIDECDDNWLAAEVAKSDAKFQQPGTPTGI